MRVSGRREPRLGRRKSRLREQYGRVGEVVRKSWRACRQGEGRNSTEGWIGIGAHEGRALMLTAL
ncbi:hypothetical protein [Streptomyces sp. NPDC059378]|uniref:hypothetical protein n=1 Tax=Streptomyces sp. NPDC059378 TaxID=3346815 RepID=UPI0036D1F4D5